MYRKKCPPENEWTFYFIRSFTKNKGIRNKSKDMDIRKMDMGIQIHNMVGIMHYPINRLKHRRRMGLPKMVPIRRKVCQSRKMGVQNRSQMVLQIQRMAVQSRSQMVSQIQRMAVQNRSQMVFQIQNGQSHQKVLFSHQFVQLEIG